MKKLNNVASIFATAALAVASSGAFAQAKTIDNWVNSNGIVWKNGTNRTLLAQFVLDACDRCR